MEVLLPEKPFEIIRILSSNQDSREEELYKPLKTHGIYVARRRSGPSFSTGFVMNVFLNKGLKNFA